MKLIDGIKAVATGHRSHIEEPLYKIKLIGDKEPDWQAKFAREYVIMITLGASEWIAEEAINASGGKVIDYAVERMRHAIVDKVYGELSYELINLRNDLRYHYGHKTSDHLNPIIEKLDEIIEKITL